jgi:hypothetical protein
MVLRKLRRPAHSTVVAYVALVFAMGGTAVAATGGSFLLGKGNVAGRTTSLANHGTGAALRLAAHNLTTPPLSVGRNKSKIRNLNADYLDGLTSAKLQRRVTGTCGSGSAISSVRAGGRVACGPRILWAVVTSTPSVARGRGAVSVERPVSNTNDALVKFAANISSCAYFVTPGLNGSTGAQPASFATTALAGGTTDTVYVSTYNGVGSASPEPFHLLVVC